MGTLLSPPGAYAAHLCIDMQNLFAPGGPWATPWMERVAPFVAALVERAPERTIFTRFIPPQTKESARGIWQLAAFYPDGKGPCDFGKSWKRADPIAFPGTGNSAAACLFSQTRPDERMKIVAARRHGNH